MSKAIRKKHLKVIERLSQATAIVSRLIAEGRTQECFTLLAECQESAVALGSHIEKLHGMNTKAVGALEVYCEALYQLSVALEEGAEIEVYASMTQLEQATKHIEDVYEEEFPDKLEVVFLPYKASMWDSLESVWMAARDDENCEAYVIPIPYYDLDDNYHFSTMHYEGEMYPEYVSITHYEDYDLEAHHPDIIYIHNPYDGLNNITSISPEFYSAKIKDYTDKLVYIPYFVLAEVDPNNRMAVERIKDFCYLPGTIYADKVIVQSENMRQIYIEEFKKEAIKDGLEISQEELEEKFLGIGSPKFDRVHNIKREELDIPQEWLKLIQKPDGSWKKIVFYNTGITAFLEKPVDMLSKIASVLETFKANREEITLLWRPHPLMNQTISSMHPELLEQYISMVESYRSEGWGIYDETADMNVAIALSDAYYGDGSSLVQVYQETGKPIMIQNVLVQ